MIEYSPFDRRTFLRRGAMGAGALWAASLGPYMARRAEGAAIASPYGPIAATADEVTGLELLKLPAGTPYLDKRSITYRNDAAGGTTNIIAEGRSQSSEGNGTLLPRSDDGGSEQRLRLRNRRSPRGRCSSTIRTTKRSS